MSGKAKRRREARRRARQRREEQMAEAPPQEEGAEEAAGPPVEEAARTAAAAEARHSRAARKRAKHRGGLWERVARVHVSPWLIATPVVAIGVGIVAVLVLTSGSSGTGGGGITELTPDPRVAGLTPDDTIRVNVNDVNFSSTELSGNAGDVIEILVTNTGTISHNMVVAGLDDEYDTGDDFEPQPFAIQPGETGRLVVKLDPPDAYRFRCAFHPTIEFGTLTLEEL